MYNSEKPYKRKILELIEKTHSTPYLSITRSIYPILKKNFNFPEVDSSDGIGTKGIYHWKNRTFKNAVLDTLAMNLNDLLLVRATPYKLQNHIMIPEDDNEAILEIVVNLVEECKKRNIAITGGETSIHNNLQGLEVGTTISGFIKNQKENKLQEGDILIGLKSSGLHSNGFTKIREIFKEEKPEFTQPTEIYSDSLIKLNEKFDIYGMMHITGGAFTKIKDIIKNQDVVINNSHNLTPQEIFQEIYKKDISDEEMYKTFNCGVGFIIGVNKKDSEEILKEISKNHEADIIGNVVKGSGKIKIYSMFSDKLIEY